MQIADDDGKVRFTSIFPACYPGRWPHIHVEVYPDQASIADSTTAIATSQVALPKNACDAVYATPGYESSVSNLAQLTWPATTSSATTAGPANWAPSPAASPPATRSP